MIVDLNDNAAKLIGKSKEEIINASCKEFVCSYNYINDSICTAHKNIVNKEARFTDCHGNEKIVRKSVLEVFYMGGVRHVVVLFDITEEKAHEQQVANMRRLESIGQLAAGVAHEINTPTQYIGDNIYFLSESMEKITDFCNFMLEECEQTCGNSSKIQAKYEDNDIKFILEEIPEAISQSEEGIKRVSEIVSAMKKFSHPGSKDKSYVDIHEAIDNTLIVTRNQWKYIAEVEKDFQADITPVPCFPADLNQALLNILVNAAQAIEEKQKNEEFNGVIKIKTYLTDGYAHVEISDNGSGIPEDVKHKIFDPFFTTKDIGKGTGQGLSIVHSIIHDKHHGIIEVDSLVGEGTTFRIKLPME